MYYGINRGELALVACSNGQRTADIIKSHLEEICKEREEALKSMSDRDFKQDYDYFQRQMQLIEYVKRNGGIKVVEVETANYDDGEIKPRIDESITGKDVFVIQNTLNPRDKDKTSHNIMEMFLMLDAVQRSDAAHTSLVLPYMSYQKQERRTGREPASAKLMIDLINTSGAERLVTMDLHAPAIESFSKSKELTINNLYASSMLLHYFLNELHFDGVWVAPDPGAGKMVRHYSKVSGFPMALGYKFRHPDSCHKAEMQQLLGDVQGKDVAILDDQSAGSGTLINMARLAKEHGANKVYGGVTHAMLLNDASNKFKDAIKEGALDYVVATNTLMQPPEFLSRNPYLQVIDGLEMFAESIFEIHVSGSISRLYEPKLRASMFGENHKSRQG